MRPTTPDTPTIDRSRPRSNRGRALVLLALSLVFAAGHLIGGAPPAAAAGTGTLTGLVRTSGGTPLPRTAVELSDLGRIGITDETGRYTIPNVPNGSHQVLVHPPCRRGLQSGTTVDGNTTEDFTATFVRVADRFGHACTIGQFALLSDSSSVALTGDDEAATVGLPFAFPFYGSTKTSMKVSTNGFLTFGPSDGRSALNAGVFTSTTPLDSIFVFWDDLLVDASASVVTGSAGAAPNRVFMVEWRNVAFLDDPGAGRVSFQVQLFENGGIAMAWRDVGTALREHGSSATIGLRNAQSSSGSDGVELLVGSDEPVVSDQLKVIWAANSPEPDAEAGADRTVPSGQAFILDGSASTGPSGRRFRWSQVSGPPTTITDSTKAKASVAGQTGPKTLTYALTVSDDFGRSNTDEVTITVQPK